MNSPAIAFILCVLGCLLLLSAADGQEFRPAKEIDSARPADWYWPELRLSWSPNGLVDTLTISSSDSATCYLYILPRPGGEDEFLYMGAIILFEDGVKLQSFSPILEGAFIYTPPERIETGAPIDTVYAYYDCPLMQELTLLARIDLYLDFPVLRISGESTIAALGPFPIGQYPEIALNWDPEAECGTLGVIDSCDYNVLFLKIKTVANIHSSWGAVKSMYK